jgi:EVE domain
MLKRTKTENNIHLVSLRTKSERINRYRDFKSWKSSRYVDGWSATKKFNSGDLALFYFGKPLSSVVALGIVDSDPYEKKGSFDWTKKNKAVFCDYKPVWFLKKHVKLGENLKRPVLNKWYQGKPYRSTRRIPQNIGILLLEKVLTLNPLVRSELVKRGFL